MRCLIDNKFLAGWHWNLAFKEKKYVKLKESAKNIEQERRCHHQSSPSQKHSGFKMIFVNIDRRTLIWAPINVYNLTSDS